MDARTLALGALGLYLVTRQASPTPEPIEEPPGFLDKVKTYAAKIGISKGNLLQAVKLLRKADKFLSWETALKAILALYGEKIEGEASVVYVPPYIAMIAGKK